MVLAGAGRTLACFVYRISFSMPNVLRKPALPSASPTSADACPKPLLDAAMVTAQVRGADGRRRAPRGRRAMRVVGAAHVAATYRYGANAHVIGRRPYPARLWIVSIAGWASHIGDSSRSRTRVGTQLSLALRAGPVILAHRGEEPRAGVGRGTTDPAAATRPAGTRGMGVVAGAGAVRRSLRRRARRSAELRQARERRRGARRAAVPALGLPAMWSSPCRPRRRIRGRRPAFLADARRPAPDKLRNLRDRA